MIAPPGRCLPLTPRLWIGLALLFCLPGSGLAQSTDHLQATSGAGRFWIAHQYEHDGRDVLDLFTGATSSPEALLAPGRLRGRLAQPGMIADGDNLLLFYTDGTVQQVRLREQEAHHPPKLRTGRQISLPAGVRVLAAAADDRHRVVLGHVDEPADLALLRQRTMPAPDQSATDEPSPVTAPPRLLPEHGADVLLLQRGADWAQAPLPESWPDPVSVAGLLLDPQAPEEIQLLAVVHNTHTGPATGVLGIWQALTGDLLEQQASAWSYRSIAWPEDMEHFDFWRVLVINGQRVLAIVRADAADADGAAHLFLWHEETLVPLGTLALPEQAQWSQSALLAMGSRVGLLTRISDDASQEQEDQDVFSLMQMSYAGDLSTARTLTATRSSPEPLSADRALTMLILGITTVLLIIAWPRELRRGPVKVAPPWQMASFARRLGAGLIDLCPWLVLAMLVYQLSPATLWMQWPGQGPPKALTQLQAPLVAIAGYVLYTTLCECLLGRTAGKWLLGLHVVDLEGLPPRRHALLLRNLLRVLDLIALVPLVLPLLWPNRQRLADVIARTLVVQKIPPEDSQPS